MLNDETRMLDRDEPGIGRSSASPVALSVPASRVAWKFRLRPEVSTILMITLGFVAVALIISAITGIPFTAPQPGNIPGMKTNYWVPPIAAALGYLLLQFLAGLFGAEKRTWREAASHAVDDYLLLGLFILVIYVHFNIKMWVPVINPNLYDQDYFAIDQAMRPLIDSFFFIRGKIAQVLPAADVWYQLAFFSVFVLSFLSHSLGRRRWHYQNMIALLLLEMAGPLSYLIRPALGPFLYERGANAAATDAELRMYDVYLQVHAGGAAWIGEHGGRFFTQPLAAMPSLHVGASFIIAYYAVKARLWVAPVTVLAFLWIFIESVVSRWHYLIDLPMGLLLAMVMIFLANHICRNAPRTTTQRHGLAGI